MLVPRIAEKHLKKLAKTFRAVAIIGPRQTGKTTLAKMAFPDKAYVSLENPSTLEFAQSDPVGFLGQFSKGAIIDEAQRLPILFSYLQEILDKSNKKAQFILTGSNNFLLQNNISQSLAGRIGYMTLLPFSFDEIFYSKKKKPEWENLANRGFYPETSVQKIDAFLWQEAYIKTYIERDVRQIKNINNLSLFTRFVRLCAGRCGQILNVQSLANDCGIDHKTVQSWLSILESSFIIFFLKPFTKNFNKQISKSPKLFFYDTGLVCNLLGLGESKLLSLSNFRGPIFENMIVAEKIKQKANTGSDMEYFYWRDKVGNEIDLISSKNEILQIVEIKSGKTINPDFWTSLYYFEKLYQKQISKWVIYGGDQNQKRSNQLDIISWKDI